MVYKWFDKNSSGSGFKSEITPNQELENVKNKKYTHLLKTIIGVCYYQHFIWNGKIYIALQKI